jgi:DNA-binding NarL/FixJ family response regulator
MRAVVAGPDAASRTLIASLVARLGCDPVEAATGDEALAAVRVSVPALVVLEVELPGLSGYQVCRELREEFGEGLPIVFVSLSRITPGDEVAGLLLGADEYIARPIREDQFLARVRRMLERSQAPGRRRSKLTPREQQVLSLLVKGMLPADIARELCITVKTTGTHIEHILGKLDARSQAQAVAFAVRDRLVDGVA